MNINRLFIGRLQPEWGMIRSRAIVKTATRDRSLKTTDNETGTHISPPPDLSL